MYKPKYAVSGFMPTGDSNPHLGILETWTTRVSKEDSWAQGMTPGSFISLETYAAGVYLLHMAYYFLSAPLHLPCPPTQSG